MTVFIWLGRDRQPTVNLVFFKEKKFTIRFKLKRRNITDGTSHQHHPRFEQRRNAETKG
jgi:hypothetical protein